MATTLFGHRYQSRLGVGHGKDGIVHQTVMNDHVSAREGVGGLQCQKTWITWASAYEQNPAGGNEGCIFHEAQMGSTDRIHKPDFVFCKLAQLWVTSLRPMPIEARACSSSVETTG